VASSPRIKGPLSRDAFLTQQSKVFAGALYSKIPLSNIICSDDSLFMDQIVVKKGFANQMCS